MTTYQTPSLSPDVSSLPESTLDYYRSSLELEIHGILLREFRRAAHGRGLTKKAIAIRLGRSPGLITRWLRTPGNLTIGTMSDLIAAMGIDPRTALSAIRAPVRKTTDGKS